MARFEIRYYLTEAAYKAGIAAFVETITGDRTFAVNWAQRKIQSTNFKFYDLREK